MELPGVEGCKSVNSDGEGGELQRQNFAIKSQAEVKLCDRSCQRGDVYSTPVLGVKGPKVCGLEDAAQRGMRTLSTWHAANGPCRMLEAPQVVGQGTAGIFGTPCGFTGFYRSKINPVISPNDV